MYWENDMHVLFFLFPLNREWVAEHFAQKTNIDYHWTELLFSQFIYIFYVLSISLFRIFHLNKKNVWKNIKTWSPYLLLLKSTKVFWLACTLLSFVALFGFVVLVHKIICCCIFSRTNKTKQKVDNQHFNSFRLWKRALQILYNFKTRENFTVSTVYIGQLEFSRCGFCLNDGLKNSMKTVHLSVRHSQQQQQRRRQQ